MLAFYIIADMGVHTQVDKHKKLSQPPQHPIPFKIINQRKKRPNMRRSRKQRQHPDNKKVVWDHEFHLGKTDALDSYSGDDLLITEGEEELSNYFCFGLPSYFAEYDEGAQEERKSCCDDEREEDLCFLI